MVMGEHEKCLHELSLIALADSNPGSLGRPGQAGQQQRGQNCDDGDYHQQLDERKRRAWPRFHFPSAFNSAPVLPSCLRRMSAILPSATSRGVPPKPGDVYGFISAPLAMSSWTICSLLF